MRTYIRRWVLQAGIALLRDVSARRRRPRQHPARISVSTTDVTEADATQSNKKLAEVTLAGPFVDRPFAPLSASCLTNRRR